MIQPPQQHSGNDFYMRTHIGWFILRLHPKNKNMITVQSLSCFLFSFFPFGIRNNQSILKQERNSTPH